MNKPIILIGSGGHAQYLLHILNQLQRRVIAYVAPQPLPNNLISDISWLDDDHDALSYDPNEVELVLGIGQLPKQNIRQKLITFYQQHNYTFAVVIAPSAKIMPNVVLGEGVQILEQAFINHSSDIDVHCIINSNATVEHDSHIGVNCHIAPGAVVCGGVTIGENSFIGANATLIQNITLTSHCIIGAGVTVTEDVIIPSLIKNVPTSISSLTHKD
ncbi:acetyltransferase [Psychrobium sp. nBUS_13]|uniref:acetyltransferase n=1 Tax=Psychrobium sp. nBUS_13 TaxID=3395319 RepID=UPI003EBAD34B